MPKSSETNLFFRPARTLAAVLFWIFLSVIFQPSQGYAADMWAKAGRGINNILFGWAEVFYRPVEMNRNGENWANSIAGGMIKGAGYAVARTLVGGYEVLSFPYAGANHYGPILLPESVILQNSTSS